MHAAHNINTTKHCISPFKRHNEHDSSILLLHRLDWTKVQCKEQFQLTFKFLIDLFTGNPLVLFVLCNDCVIIIVELEAQSTILRDYWLLLR